MTATSSCRIPHPKDVRRKLELKIEKHVEDEHEHEAASSSPSFCPPREPRSPDSGFSSDDGAPCFINGNTLSPSPRSALKKKSQLNSLKKVRFADSEGKQLVEKNYFQSLDHINPFDDIAPQVASSSSSSPSHSPSSSTSSHLITRPSPQIINSSAIRIILSNFEYLRESEHLRKARENKVAVSSLKGNGASINGQVNVLNIAYDKKVVIRFTTTNWLTYRDIQASYGHSISGNNDVEAFIFSITLPPNLKASSRCEFCVKYTVAGQDHWDNNGGDNFRIEVAEDNIQKSPKSLSLASESPFSRRFRRWGQAAQDDSDTESSSRLYIPSRCATL